MEQREFDLDADTAQLIREISAEGDKAAAAARAPFDNQIIGIIQATMRVNKLAGVWGPNSDATKMTRRDVPPVEIEAPTIAEKQKRKR